MQRKRVIILMLSAATLLGGCLLPMNSSGNDPGQAVIAGAAGLADAAKTREAQKQRQEQKAVEDYLNKTSR